MLAYRIDTRAVQRARQRLGATSVLLTALALGACDLDFTNPNDASSDVVLTTAEGLIAATVGLQARYSDALDSYVYPAGLLTNELGATSGALPGYYSAEVGEVSALLSALPGDLWNTHYRTIKSADDIINNVDNVTFEAGMRSGMLTLAYLLKGAAIGQLIQGFEQIALGDLTNDQLPFVSREVALQEARDLLDQAQTQFESEPPGATFNSTVLATGLDLGNTIAAMQARYARMADDWPAAIAAADRVDLSTLSLWPFGDQAINPLVDLSIYVLPADAWRLSAEPRDERVDFHVTVAEVEGRTQPLDRYGQFTGNASPIPAYWPDEIRLIRAEALLETGQAQLAQEELELVRTQCNEPIAEPQACIAPLGGQLDDDALREEIYVQRRFELFATGQSWEDARRLNRVGQFTAPMTMTLSRAQRCWLPYPQGERNANRNVPDDPEPETAPTFPATCF